MRAPSAFASVVLVVAALGAACGPTVVKASCVPVVAFEVDQTARCFHPSVMPAGLSACTDPLGAPPDGGDALVCLVDRDGRIYLATVASMARISGAGWTYEEYGPFASTLAPADEARCAAVATVNPASACP